jgi:hypothetical protein
MRVTHVPLRGGLMPNDLLAKLPQLEREADEYERKAHALRQIIAGVRSLNGEAEAILTGVSFESHRERFDVALPPAKGPRGQRAVLQIMSEDAERSWKVVELKREMLRRGWAPSPKAVEASVKKLREVGRIESVSYGFYKLAGNGDKSETPSLIPIEEAGD